MKSHTIMCTLMHGEPTRVIIKAVEISVASAAFTADVARELASVGCF